MPEVFLMNLHFADFPKSLGEILDELIVSNVRIDSYILAENVYKLHVTDKNAIRIIKKFFITKYNTEISLFYVSKWGFELN